jgi:hypothetical protein
MKIKLKKKTNQYAQVHINLLRDKNLSLKAKGLGAVLESYSNDFDVSIKSIEINSKDGARAIKTAIKELEKGYYLFRFQTHDETGKFITYWTFDSQKLEINYLKTIIKELEKVDLITPNSLDLPGYRNDTSVTCSTEVSFSTDGFSTDGKCTTYNNITYKNKKDKNTLSLKKDKRESFNFKRFKDYVCNCKKIGFTLQGKLGYSDNHAGFSIENGYIYSLQTQKLLEKEEAYKVWDYLYQNRSKIFNLIDNLKEEEVKNAS